MSLVTLRRYLDDERLGFPKPLIINSRRKLWRVADLIAWEQARSALNACKTA
jgi:predicted DNA-binding transcriptional regulator AlpA